jgi:hypothetical protein
MLEAKYGKKGSVTCGCSGTTRFFQDYSEE